jgi:glucose-6-phosphate 1-dehydrogenase
MNSFTLVIFGFTSNLAQIKLIPTLYDLVAGTTLKNTSFQIVGVGRTPMDTTELDAYVDRVLHTPNRHHTHAIDPLVQRDLMSHLHYLTADLTHAESYRELETYLANLPGNRMYYLATFPSLYEQIFTELNKHQLLKEDRGWVRLMIEKPIGTDQSSAQALNTLLTTYLREDQIFRLDHYLGKETLQNILTFRFGNGIFEPLMNPEYIDHLQVTATEDFGIGARGSYYDQNGALKDVGQNHLLQMIALATMDTPDAYTTQAIMTKRIEAIQGLVPDGNTLVTGQYDGYVREKDVSPTSTRETYFAFRTSLTRTQFAGIPIYVRGGKMLQQTATEIAIIFKDSQARRLSEFPGGKTPNILIYRIQPSEGIVLKLITKVPGHEFELKESYMQYCYPHTANLPDAYERLIIDALRGEQMFFNDASEVDAQWAFTDALIPHMKTPIVYPAGTWGPAEADAMIARDGRAWLEPSTAFCQF